MARHAAYLPRARYPFASFPHADAARRWLEAHPDAGARFVPPLPDDAPDDTLGPCGCTDYHLADCPTRTGGGDGSGAWAWAERRARLDDDGWADV